MPSHKIHIKIAEEVNKELNFQEESLMLGSILPDLVTIKTHSESHFKTIPENHTFYNKELFIDKYLKDNNNSFLVGYLIHIMTDEFYNKYFREKYYIVENDNFIGIKLKDKIIYDKELAWTLKQQEFTSYDYYLMMNKQFKSFIDKSIIDSIPKIDECDYDINYLKEYINTYNNQIEKYKSINQEIVFEIMSIEELDKLFELCIEYIKTYLKNNLNNVEKK